MIWHELRHRWGTFALAVAVVAIAGCYAIVMVAWMDQQYADQSRRVAQLDDEIRKITKDLGFNINILPKDQNLAEFYAQDFASKTMPYEYVTRLAESRDVVTINHLRPALIGKLAWEEQQRQVILMGVTGVIPWAHRANAGQPLSRPVETGTVHLGAVLAQELQLTPGDTTLVNGTELRVAEVYPPRGNDDDITLWADLAWAQQQLNLPGRINLIQALECNCASIDRLAEIDREIMAVLGGDVQVHELSTIAIARAKTRVEVQRSGEAALAGLQQWSLRTIMGLTVAAALTIGCLAALNVRQRRQEIGLLRALGTPTGKIMGLFLGKAIVLGLVGAALGLITGALVARLALGQPLQPSDLAATSWWRVAVASLVMAPGIAVLATWLPTLAAANQDPAVVLRND